LNVVASSTTAAAVEVPQVVVSSTAAVVEVPVVASLALPAATAAAQFPVVVASSTVAAVEVPVVVTSSTGAAVEVPVGVALSADITVEIQSASTATSMAVDDVMAVQTVSICNKLPKECYLSYNENVIQEDGDGIYAKEASSSTLLPHSVAPTSSIIVSLLNTLIP